MELCCPSLPLHPSPLLFHHSITLMLLPYSSVRPLLAPPSLSFLLHLLSTGTLPDCFPLLCSFLFSVCFFFSFSGLWVVWIKRQTWCTSRLELTVDVSLFLFFRFPILPLTIFSSFLLLSQFLSSSLPCSLSLSFLLSPASYAFFFLLCRSEKWTDELWTTVNSIVNGSGFVLADSCAYVLSFWDSVVH